MRAINYKIGLGVLSLFIHFSVLSQEMLEKDEAVLIALENNFDIKIADNNVEVASNNASIENSNYLPSLFGSAGANYANSNGTITQKSGVEQEINNNETYGYNASISLSYTIFDGFGRSNTYKKLQESYNISLLEAQLMIQNTVLNIFNSYYEVARLSEDVNNREEAMATSRVRLQRAKFGNEYGQGSELDILNAEVDYNNDSIVYLTNLQLLANEKRTLNLYLGRDVTIEFTVDTSISYAQDLILDTLLAHSMENNVSILQQEGILRNREFEIKSTTSNMIPKLTANAGYNWSENFLGAASFIDKSIGSGPNLGATLSWNIYDGGLTKTNMQNSKIALENQAITLEKERLSVERNLTNAWTIYQTALFVKEAQQKNLQTAQINFDRSVDQYKLGQISNIVFRQAQVNLLNAQLELNNAKYKAKIAELVLFQLSGELNQATF
jgi:outer membrane protein TolC